jgi:hypothetical protein
VSGTGFFDLIIKKAVDMVAIEMERGKAAMLLGVLEHRLETIQKLEKTARDRSAAAANAREKEAIIPAIMALAAALKVPRR